MQTKQVIATLFTAIVGIQALPAELSTRQTGGDIAVVNGYSAGGCTDLIEAFPIFNTVNLCQPFATGFTVVSAETLSVEEGCSVFLWSSTDCSGASFLAPVNQCVQGSAPFQSINVICH
ncbi:hypothetical protein AOQ84DRAFT_375842 [Glonium stellatum]|uniref:Uncharacterized protein n=1 Tax=Glonium stellatum TaxID=574774 RepID=A0A8E2F3T8_9PEZI|nr:hypothetical protein AOQ84DRAFT_375842 [Glonium stellatum]